MLKVSGPGGLALMVGLMLLAILSCAAGAAELGSEKPDHIVMGQVEGPNTTAAFTWRTAPVVNKTVIEWWPVDAPDSIKTALGESSLFKTTLGDMCIHKVQIKGLQPGTTYRYRVGDGTEARWSTPNEFTTASTEGPVSILVLTDTQSSPSKYNVWGDTLLWARTDEIPDDMLVLPGDIVEYGGDQTEWEQWFAAVRNEALGRIPVLPAIGNHEISVGGRGKNNGEYVVTQFQTPGNGPTSQKGLVYSLDYRDVHIVIQNSEVRSQSDIEAQKRWLTEDLSQSKARWKVVFLHRPIYESVKSWSNSYLMPYVSIWEQYGVDVVVTGHDHVYMRTYPIENGVMTVDQPLSLSKGIVYVTAGRGGSNGAPSDIYQPEQAARYQRLSGPNFVNLLFSQNEVRIRSRYASWGVIDDVVLQK